MSVDPQLDYFLDTSILVYAYDRTAGQKHTLASQLVESCWENENGCLSIQVLAEFFMAVTRKIAIRQANCDRPGSLAFTFACGQ